MGTEKKGKIEKRIHKGGLEIGRYRILRAGNKNLDLYQLYYSTIESSTILRKFYPIMMPHSNSFFVHLHPIINNTAKHHEP